MEISEERHGGIERIRHRCRKRERWLDVNLWLAPYIVELMSPTTPPRRPITKKEESIKLMKTEK